MRQCCANNRGFIMHISNNFNQVCWPQYVHRFENSDAKNYFLTASIFDLLPFEELYKKKKKEEEEVPPLEMS